MPYLFRNYEHAEAVFKSPIGEKLIGSLEKNSGLKAFGMTYSGGMGVISTNDIEARDPKVFNGMSLLISRTMYSKIAAYFNGFVVNVGPEGLVPLSKVGLVDAAETTVTCFLTYEDYKVFNVVNETHHFLLSSMIVMNKNFFEKLPEKYQELISRIAADVAKKERQWSIEGTKESRKLLTARGIKFVDLTENEMKRYKDRLEPLYEVLLNNDELKLANEIRNFKY